MKKSLLIMSISFLAAQQAHAILLTDLNDARVWQGAKPGTFVPLYNGSDALSNRQQVSDNPLQDDGLFDTSGYRASTYANTLDNLRLQTEGMTAAIIQGGQGALMQDGDNQINRILAAKKNYRPLINIPEPSSLGLMVLGAIGMFIIRRRNREV